MKIERDSSIEQVAAAVAAAFDNAGLRAVLTGGAAAVIHSGGEYQSEDLDFILESAPSQERLDSVLSGIGFMRKGDHYVHRLSPFFIEFLRGPLSIGRDIQIQPAETLVGRQKVLTLSPTDSCRDRLAAFYHWNDRQSLQTALQIAARNQVDLELIRTWSIGSGKEAQFNAFRRELELNSASRAPRHPGHRR